MKKILLAIALFIAAASAIYAQTQTRVTNIQSRIEQELRRITSETDGAFERSNTAFFERNFAEDFAHTDASGRLQTRAEFLAEMKSGDLKYDSYLSDDVRVVIHGNSAIVNGRTTRRGRSAGREINDQLRFTRIYVRRRGRWLAVAQQSTNIVRR